MIIPKPKVQAVVEAAKKLIEDCSPYDSCPGEIPICKLCLHSSLDGTHARSCEWLALEEAVKAL